MAEPTFEVLAEKLMELVPVDGESVGNISLIRDLGWQEETYWNVRNRLVDRGDLELGRGKGGSVRRAATIENVAELSIREAVVDLVDETEVQLQRELDLYSAMAKVIEESWVKASGFDSAIVQITAQQGRRLTGGKWSRPDIAAVSLSTYPYIPGRHFDVFTFEIKTADSIDITCIYEALSHRRSATRSYVLLHVPAERAKDLDPVLLDVYAEGKKHGIGVITAGRPDDYGTWDQVVDPVRAEPDPRRLNDFLAVQFTGAQREQIVKWFK